MLEITSSDALDYTLKFTDPIPAAADFVFERDITAGYEEVIRYTIPLGTPMTDPVIEWK